MNYRALANPFSELPGRAEHAPRRTAAASTTPPQKAAASRFRLDEQAFMSAIRPVPAFIAEPSPEFLDMIRDLDAA